VKGPTGNVFSGIVHKYHMIFDESDQIRRRDKKAISAPKELVLLKWALAHFPNHNALD